MAVDVVPRQKTGLNSIRARRSEWFGIWSDVLQSRRRAGEGIWHRQISHSSVCVRGDWERRWDFGRKNPRPDRGSQQWFFGKTARATVGVAGARLHQGARVCWGNRHCTQIRWPILHWGQSIGAAAVREGGGVGIGWPMGGGVALASKPRALSSLSELLALHSP